MSIFKSAVLLIAVVFLGNNCIAQNKKKGKPKENKSLTVFLKDLNKDLLTSEAIKKQSNDKPLKTLFVYYKDGMTIVSPVKNDL